MKEGPWTKESKESSFRRWKGREYRVSHMIQQLRFWVDTQRNQKQDLKELLVHPCHRGTVDSNQNMEVMPRVHHDEWTNKFHPKRKEILTHATTWINPEDIRSEINSHKRTSIIWFLLYAVPTAVRFTETESRRVDAQGWEEGTLSNGYMFICSVWPGHFWRVQSGIL